MTPEQQQEEISKAYVHAIAASCGYTIGTWSQDHGALDVTVAAPSKVGDGLLSRPKLDLQLKATRDQSLVKKEFLSWQLEIDHYNILRQESASPMLLVVLLLDTTTETSIAHSVEELVIRKCAYWVKMSGMAETTAKKKPTVRLPLNQTFSPATLLELMTKISKKESI